MRSLRSRLILIACGALLAAVGVPALADDVVVFDVSQQARIGSLVLDPGSYVIRSDTTQTTRSVVTVWNAAETSFIGFVLATCSPMEGPIPADVLVYGDDGRTITAWNVARKGTTYTFSAAPPPAPPAPEE